MLSEGEDILWISQMLGHKDSDITLKRYAKAYEVYRDKTKRKTRASFLKKGTVLGTVETSTAQTPQEIGDN